jgi:hypothetical protein
MHVLGKVLVVPRRADAEKRDLDSGFREPLARPAARSPGANNNGVKGLLLRIRHEGCYLSLDCEGRQFLLNLLRVGGRVAKPLPAKTLLCAQPDDALISSLPMSLVFGRRDTTRPPVFRQRGLRSERSCARQC